MSARCLDRQKVSALVTTAMVLFLGPVACTRGQSTSDSAAAPVVPAAPGISLRHANLAAIPGSQRSVYADVEGMKDIGVNWTVTGGCTLSQKKTAGWPEIVTAPAKGASCKYQSAQPTNEEPSFQSAVSCRITATSVADPSKSASIVIPVCAPAVALDVFPASTVLYKKQYAVIQSDLRGSVETGVRWEIVKNPGGAGELTGGATNRHAVFSASAPGAYVLQATSVADPMKKAESTIYVTAHDMPAPNADHTELVDCTAVGSGKSIDVGPDQPLKHINDVSWNNLGPGDTVRIHNDDRTGSAPTEYHEHFVISSAGTRSEPIRVCGVPDAHGNKPIVDGANSTGRTDGEWSHGSLEQRAGILIFGKFTKSNTVGSKYIALEGLHVRNVNASVNYVRIADGKSVPYFSHAQCLNVQQGQQVLVRGNEMESCPQGVFSNGSTPSANMVEDLTVEGNYIHNWGWPNNDKVHGVYLQGVALQVQFNDFGPGRTGAIGDLIKSRSVLQFIRWNYLEQAEVHTTRAINMVEPQAFVCYMIPDRFAWSYHGPSRAECGLPHWGAKDDPYTADEVAANFELYHSDYVYGNIIDDSGSKTPYVHYGYDQNTPNGASTDRRPGTLFYYDNTHVYRGGELKTAFDPYSPDYGASYEFPTIQSINNVYVATGSGKFQWTRPYWAQITLDSNWATPWPMLATRKTKDYYQMPVDFSTLKCDEYNQCGSREGGLVWRRKDAASDVKSVVLTGADALDLKTYSPSEKLRGLASPLPARIKDLPSNMEYVPSKNMIVPRKADSTLGALDR